jgi:glycerol-3-phosphate O-acyltransferase
MDPGRILLRPLYWLAEKILALWARPAVVPEAPAELFPGAGVPVCYVFESGGLADTLVFERLARQHGLVSPTAALKFGSQFEPNRIIVLRRKTGFLFRRPSPRGSSRLHRLVEASLAEGGKELLLVPIAIYWGRAPDKETSFLQSLFSENWEFAGRTRKFFVTLFQGRNTLLSVSRPMSLSAITSDMSDPEFAFRKVLRILRVHFRQRRIATVGPDLSHRRTLANAVLSNPAVQQVIDEEASGDRALRAHKSIEAREYTAEIAAHISYSTVRAVERLLSWVWNRIYDGIELQHAARLHEVANDKEIIYVPCHRSHFDYLLLSYIVYHQGLSLPHVAACRWSETS